MGSGRARPSTWVSFSCSTLVMCGTLVLVIKTSPAAARLHAGSRGCTRGWLHAGFARSSELPQLARRSAILALARTQDFERAAISPGRQDGETPASLPLRPTRTRRDRCVVRRTLGEPLLKRLSSTATGATDAGAGFQPTANTATRGGPRRRGPVSGRPAACPQPRRSRRRPSPAAGSPRGPRARGRRRDVGGGGRGAAAAAPPRPPQTPRAPFLRRHTHGETHPPPPRRRRVRRLSASATARRTRRAGGAARCRSTSRRRCARPAATPARRCADSTGARRASAAAPRARAACAT